MGTVVGAGDGADKMSTVPARLEPAVPRDLVTAHVPTWERLA